MTKTEYPGKNGKNEKSKIGFCFHDAKTVNEVLDHIYQI